MQKLTLFRNLMVLAASDGKVTEEEVMFLSLRAANWGIDDKEFHAALEFARSRQAELQVPGDEQERLEMLRDMLRMMAVDGELADIERKLFAVAAASVGLERQDINDLIDDVVSERS